MGGGKIMGKFIVLYSDSMASFASRREAESFAESCKCEAIIAEVVSEYAEVEDGLLLKTFRENCEYKYGEALAEGEVDSTLTGPALIDRMESLAESSNGNGWRRLLGRAAAEIRMLRKLNQSGVRRHETDPSA